MCVLLCCAVPAGDLTGGRWGPFWDKLVFSKIRERVGGEVKYMTTGGSRVSFRAHAVDHVHLLCLSGTSLQLWCEEE
jgi:long-chain acyl-CoA synthetase